MPIPFRDDDAVDALGSAGFLKLKLVLDRSEGGACCLGGLLVINARGVPLEFAYNRVRVPHAFLWRQADLHRYIERRLAASLLSVCTHQLRLLLYLANEVGPALFTEDIRVEFPVGQVSAPPTVNRTVDPDTGEVLEESVVVPHVAWQSATPARDSIEQQLFECLGARQLLYEPFDRAGLGLREAYASRAAGAE
jgi:hypothetical protein